MGRKTRIQSAGLRFLQDRYVGNDPKRIASYEDAQDEADIAQEIYRLRTANGLTQQQLAQRVQTTASTICRLEDADYEGHSLSMLRRIAAAVGSRVVVQFAVAKAHPLPKLGPVASKRVAIKAPSAGKAAAKGVAAKGVAAKSVAMVKGAKGKAPSNVKAAAKGGSK
jgi:transcriptional regulator with XRE-family HTH domain